MNGGPSQLAIFSISSRSSVSNLSIFLSEEKEKDSKTSTRGYCGDIDPGEAASRDRHTQVSPWPGASPSLIPGLPGANINFHFIRWSTYGRFPPKTPRGLGCWPRRPLHVHPSSRCVAGRRSPGSCCRLPQTSFSHGR